jgi:hypothetical protein
MLFDKPAKFCKIVYSRIFSHQVGRGSLEMLSIKRRAYIEALSYATREQRLSRRQTEEREHDCITIPTPSARVNCGCLTTKGSLQNMRANTSAWL